MRPGFRCAAAALLVGAGLAAPCAAHAQAITIGKLPNAPSLNPGDVLPLDQADPTSSTGLRTRGTTLSGLTAFVQSHLQVATYQLGAGDGTTTAFALPATIDPSRATVAIAGLPQAADAYRLTSTTLTFSAPPPPLARVSVTVGAILVTLYNGGDGSAGLVGAPQVFPFTGDGVTTSFPLPAAPQTLDRYSVTVGGVLQSRSACSLTAAALTCVAPPPDTTAIEVVDGP